MKASHPDDPLRRLGKKALRRLAQQYKIKHFYRKSPASLRRAIRRAQERQQLLPDARAAKSAALSPEELADQRHAAEIKAYEEHRLRYLFMPSRFVHKGTHQEYLLEKDEELDLPDFYQEDELVALPIDPYRFYVYWDFAEETLYDVRSWLAEENPFLMRIYDVSELVFNGSNAHNSWEAPCHPLVREWYLNAPVNGRDLIVELGVRQATGFRSILRSNTIYVPPASVSSITGDIFAHFVPSQAGEPLKPLTPGQEERPIPKPDTSAHLFFQEYIPSPVKYNPPPPPKTILSREAHFTPAEQHPVHAPAHPAPAAQVPRPQPGPLAVPPTVQQPSFEAPPEHWPDPPPADVRHDGPIGIETEWNEQDVISYLSEGGSATLNEWLGLPHEIRWLSDMPMGMSPIFFEHWIDDPYDRALMISYAIWPWELTEYMPLGASDWIARKFLGASLFSWYMPGGSERMRWWQGPAGASESSRWQRPLGASEVSWSGAMQPSGRPQRNAWYLWPVTPSGQGRFGPDSGQASGKGLFG
ncbi:MAG TPA: DUF4912 domain-containing protein [Candidatus Obscuribacterales bacterium]